MFAIDFGGSDSNNYNPFDRNCFSLQTTHKMRLSGSLNWFLEAIDGSLNLFLEAMKKINRQTQFSNDFSTDSPNG